MLSSFCCYSKLFVVVISLCFLLPGGVVLSFSVPRPVNSRLLLLHPLSSTTTEQQQPTTTAAVDLDTTTATKTTNTIIQKPVIHWTVPGFKVGWQDDNGNWYDEDGPRKGPPLNYWRQRLDEREYNRDMKVIDMIVSLPSTTTPNNTTATLLEELNQMIEETESSSSVRRPSMNRKLLGEWGPILRCGTRVATSEGNDDGDIHIPFRMNVYRSHGRQFSPKTVYGLFDASLKEGEMVTVKVNNDDNDDHQPEDQTYEFAANLQNEPFICDMVQDKPLCLGGITYLSDYILIQRGPEGDVDVWLRLDDAYLGQNSEEVDEEEEEMTTKQDDKDDLA